MWRPDSAASVELLDAKYCNLRDKHKLRKMYTALLQSSLPKAKRPELYALSGLGMGGSGGVYEPCSKQAWRQLTP